MIERECRKLRIAEREGKQRAPNDLFADLDVWNMRRSKPFSYHGRDIVRENKRNQIIYRPRQSPAREVPAFTIQSQQKNTVTGVPPSTKTQTAQQNSSGEWGQFRLLYDRGDLPVRIEPGATGERYRSLRWLKEPSLMSADYLTVLFPRFCLGLPLLDQPYRFIAETGVNDLLNVPFINVVIINCLPQIIPSIRAALYSFDVEKKKSMLNLLARITQKQSCGPALVPYYRQLLPPLRQTSYCGLKSDIDYKYGKSVDEMIDLTLHKLEKTGGSLAYINIKYIIPAYESCIGAR